MSEKKSEMVAVMLPRTTVELLSSNQDRGFEYLADACKKALRPEPPRETTMKLLGFGRDAGYGTKLNMDTCTEIYDWIEWVLEHGHEVESMANSDFSTPEAMREILARVVEYAGRNSIKRVPRWSHVGSITGHGSGYSADICREFGADPDELVGGLREGKYCPSCGYCQGCLTHEYLECDDDCEVE
jgi:hypothetical protein